MQEAYTEYILAWVDWKNAYDAYKGKFDRLSANIDKIDSLRKKNESAYTAKDVACDAKYATSTAKLILQNMKSSFELGAEIAEASDDFAAKANTMNNTFDDCIIVVATHASVSNRIVTAEGTKDIPAVELFTQTQSLENSGTDTTTQTTTQTPTTDVKPDIDVRYNDAIAGATSASKGVLDLLTDTGKAAVLELMSSKKSGTVKVEKTDGSSATVKCENGQCEFCEECTVN